jgi:hypothetical protein
MKIKRFYEKLIDKFVVPFANIGIMSMATEAIKQLEIKENFLIVQFVNSPTIFDEQQEFIQFANVITETNI